MPSLTFEQIVTLLGVLAAGIGAVWAFFTKRIIPARLEQQARRLEAELEETRDEREHRQEQHRLERAYHLSEGAVAQQMLTELLADSQEEQREVNNYIRQDVKDCLTDIKDDTALLRKMSDVKLRDLYLEWRAARQRSGKREKQVRKLRRDLGFLELLNPFSATPSRSAFEHEKESLRNEQRRQDHIERRLHELYGHESQACVAGCHWLPEGVEFRSR